MGFLSVRPQIDDLEPCSLDELDFCSQRTRYVVNQKQKSLSVADLKHKPALAKVSLLGLSCLLGHGRQDLCNLSPMILNDH